LAEPLIQLSTNIYIPNTWYNGPNGSWHINPWYTCSSCLWKTTKYSSPQKKPFPR